MIVTDSIKAQILQEMTKQGISQTDLVDKTGLYQSSLSRLLSGKHKGVSHAWQTVLKALGLELVAVPKDRLQEIQELLRSNNPKAER